VSSQTVEKFGNRIRLRVCGLLFKGEDLLLINHKGLYDHDFWAPPGGGVEFGEKAENALKREFLEECGLHLTSHQYVFTCEFVKPPLHAIELFFIVQGHGEPQLGRDPEMDAMQLITDFKFWSDEALATLPPTNRHGILSQAKTLSRLPGLRGFYPLPNM